MSYGFLFSFWVNLRSTETRIIITHIMPKAMSTSLASPMMSNCDIVSANVEPPRVNGEPGVTLGVGLGVGIGVGVGMGVGVGEGDGRLVGGGGVTKTMGFKVMFGRGGASGLG